jgi:PPOX class probable F420-dependent enzyme
MGTLSMSVEEREAFLAGLHVGVVSVERADGSPLTVPVWYGYEPGGEVWFVTDRDSVKGRLLQAAGRFSLCAQSEALPYAYVTVEGPATIGPADLDAHQRPLAHRYLGPELGEQYLASGADGADAIRVAMRPARWWTVDYGKLGGA